MTNPRLTAETEARICEAGYARLAAADTLTLIGNPDAAAWDRFVGSWEDLGPDVYMADGGRYRRRRHAAFRFAGGVVERKPHQAHFQSRDYNRLNGDVQRWFEPVLDEIAAGPVIQAILLQCGRLFSAVDPRGPTQPWHVELHQFRIEASADAEGRPTPEGPHRDGVDWVFVMLVARENVLEGVTEISAPDGWSLGSFTLEACGDAIALDDHRVLHGVTPITPIDVATPAYRDALVVTFVAEIAAASEG